ncbi:MAG: KTSC domain-containing protein, partial [Pyrinomonadaceae bacterium]
GVPTRVHEDLINAFSKGKYYTVYIKDAYSFRRIK